MKYRIKEIQNCRGSKFYPQRKWLFFWHNIWDETLEDDLHYSSLVSAKLYVKNSQTPTKIIIHEV